jgi:hypothetical protein
MSKVGGNGDSGARKSAGSEECQRRRSSGERWDGVEEDNEVLSTQACRNGMLV